MTNNSTRGALRLGGLISLGALVLGGVIGSYVTARTGRSVEGAVNVPTHVAAASPLPAADVSFENGFVPVVKRDLPAVVNIASTKITRTKPSPFFSDPFFRQFFGNQFAQPRVQREQSLGSGVIISSEGNVLTNYHVIEGASTIKISLDGAREFPAQIIGGDQKTDIAVLKVEAKNLPVMMLGDSSGIQVGDFVLAMGNPFGLGQTVTMGIISATGRAGLGIEDYEDFIQTDASINPGNSGGALVNVKGELIGINTAILTGDQGGGSEGVGFAIPINLARQVMGQILKNGRVVRGYLGAYIQAVSPDIARMFGLPGARGALLADVQPNGPAAEAGLKRGDIILEFENQPVTDSSQFRLKLAMTPPGTSVRLHAFRDGSERDFTVKLGELPGGARQEAARAAAPAPQMPPLKGITVQALTPQILKELRLPAQTRGVVVTDVQSESAAAAADVRSGDVIEEIDRKPVTTVSEFEQFARQRSDKPALLLVNRGGTTFYTVIESQ